MAQILTKKIIEINYKDWAKGISAQPSAAIGGLFQGFTGCDPFEQTGVALPSLVPATISPATTPTALTNWNDGAGNAYVYVHTATKLYRVLKDSPYTITDVTAQITVNACNNAILFDSGYVYAGSDLRFNALPVASGTDVQLAAGFNGTMDFNALCIGKDKNLYVAQNSRVGQVLLTSHTWTSLSFAIDGNFNVRDMVNDGQYLVIIADNNAPTLTGRQVGNYRCRVYFWDLSKAQADVIYDIKDSYLISAKILDDSVYIFGYKGMYVCSSATAPKMIRPMVGSKALTLAKPNSPAQVTSQNGSLYWVDGGTNTLYKHNVHAYGNPITGEKKIFYSPYVDTGANMLQTVIQTVGDQFWVGGDTPAIYVHNIGTTRGNMNITTLDIPMELPHKFDYTKVVLTQPLSSGQSVSHNAVSQNNANTVSTSDTRTFANVGAKQSFLFRRSATANQSEKFENLRLNISTTGGAAVQRVSTYATPMDDTNEEL